MNILKRSVVSGLCSTLIVLFLSSVLPAVESALTSTATSTVPGGKQSVEDVIPLTMGNLRGHKMLYNEGWYVVSSSRKALDFAKKHSLARSRDALADAAASAAGRSKDYAVNIESDVKGAVEGGKRVWDAGTELTGDILRTTHRAGKAELAYSSETFRRAGETFIQGNLSLGKRTAEDRKELAALPGNYFTDLKDDFSNIWELTSTANDKFAGKIEAGWDKAFDKATTEFKKEYDRSGESKNTLTALGPILYGYLKSIYHGIVAPSSKTIVKTGASAVTYAGAYGVFLPAASTAVVAGRTVQSVGLTFYYTGKSAVKIVSPTVESGLLAGMSVLSLSAVPVTYAAGGTLGAVNQVAFTAAGPVAGTAQGAATTGADTAIYVGLVAYDGIKGTTKVVINQASSGVVLGYNALTAIPTHLVEGVVDTAVFLAWDGPRLVIAAASGKLKTGSDGADQPTLGDLPVGTAVDLKKLEQSQGIKAKVITTDPAVIRDVLEKLPADLRTEGESHE
ncbi:MAG: hypothetical protein AABZ15_08385 [Nitrospirota bacterium]